MESLGKMPRGIRPRVCRRSTKANEKYTIIFTKKKTLLSPKIEIT